MSSDRPRAESGAPAEVPGPTSAGVGWYRWRVCALLFFATAISYIDRQVVSILAPQLEEHYGWTEAEHGYLVLAFQAAYAVGLFGVGTLMDRLGTRRGFALAVAFWSLAAMAHALDRSLGGFAYLFALLVIHLLAPRLDPARIEAAEG